MVCNMWFQISSRYFGVFSGFFLLFFFLYLTLKNEKVQDAIPISFFFFSEAGNINLLNLLVH